MGDEEAAALLFCSKPRSRRLSDSHSDDDQQGLIVVDADVNGTVAEECRRMGFECFGVGASSDFTLSHLSGSTGSSLAE